MKIKLITGKRNANIKKVADKQDNVVWFPETEIMHSYDLVDKIMMICENHYKENKDLTIVSYSEIVLDAMRLWGARTKHCYIIECHNVFDNGEIHISKFSEDGQMDFWEPGIFDTVTVILRELSDLRRNIIN